jgi:hypothetical protein
MGLFEKGLHFVPFLITIFPYVSHIFSPLKWSFHCRGNPRRPLKRKELSASKPSTTPLGRTAQKNWRQFDETQRNEFLKLTVLALDLFGSQAMVLVLEVHI